MKNHQPMTDLLPEHQRESKSMMMGELRRENGRLRCENENLRPLKGQIARLRSSLADFFFANSEKG